MIDKLYTVEEVAELASVTGRTIRNYLKSGRLVGRKIGGQWRFPETEVQRLLTGGPPPVLDEEVDVPVAPAPPPVVYADPAPVAVPPAAASEEPTYVPPVETPAPIPYTPPVQQVQPPAVLEEVTLAPPAAQPPPVPQSAPAPAHTPPSNFTSEPAAAPQPTYAPQPQMPSAAPPEYQPAPASTSMPQPPVHQPYIPQPAYPPQAPQVSQAYTPHMDAPVQTHSGYSPIQQHIVSSAPVTGAVPYPPYTVQPDTYNPYTATQQPLYPTPLATGIQAPMDIPYQYIYASVPYSPQFGGYTMQTTLPAVAAAEPKPTQQPALPTQESAPAESPKEEPKQEESSPQQDKPEQIISDVGLKVTRFMSEVHDCSLGPIMCAVVDMNQSLSSAKLTSERLNNIADQESEEGQPCQCFVEFDDRYYVARYTLFGSTAFLIRCLKLIG